MSKKLTFFLPTRKGSQRIENKNTRPFSSFSGGLLENKLIQLSNVLLIDEIILSTNDEECIKIGERFLSKCPKLKIVERPEELCLSTTNLKDLITYLPTITDAKHFLWGHVTTPFFDAFDYDDAINNYFNLINKGYDSLVSVKEFKNFMLNKDGKVINNKSKLPWPRTQDLEIFYEINHAVFLTNREIYLKSHDRIGKKPFLYVCDVIKSIDVDWEDDFKIAEIIYDKFYKI
jgi:CMP-N-acetylneuraminic acid synthetase